MWIKESSPEYRDLLEYPTDKGLHVDIGATIDMFKSHCSSRTIGRDDLREIGEVIEKLESLCSEWPASYLLQLATREGSSSRGPLDEYSLCELLELLKSQLSRIESGPVHQSISEMQPGGLRDALENVRDEFETLCRAVGINMPVKMRVRDEPTLVGWPLDLCNCVLARIEKPENGEPPVITLEVDERLLRATKPEQAQTLKAEVYRLVDDTDVCYDAPLPEGWPSPDAVHEAFDAAEEQHVFRYPENSLVVFCGECSYSKAYAPITGAYGTCPDTSCECPECGGHLDIALVGKPLFVLSGAIYLVSPDGSASALDSRTIEENASLALDHLVQEGAVTSLREVMRAVYMSSGGMRFEDAWCYLASHPMYRGRFPELLDVGFMRVNAGTGRWEAADSGLANTEPDVYIETGGPGFECASSSTGACFIGNHDLGLNTGGSSFEEAIINLASILKTRDEMFGDS